MAYTTPSAWYAQSYIGVTIGDLGVTLPVAYASAVTGGSVNTDGTPVFRAAQQFLLQVTITPQLVGPVSATVNGYLASITWWIDPKITLN